ncbi:SDR family NAD(P)-dependent oxidoreductase [Clostridium thailandense]|uniref:SDR family NAD(P)-dependent oxidoreductase n=1 Tax=Clostridium thailandense TaxID=2794346 RepID=UPI0039894C85
MTKDRKIALVTGGSRGIGRNSAISLSKKGIDVIITYNNQKDKADEVVASLCTDEIGWVNGQRIEASGGMAL